MEIAQNNTATMENNEEDIVLEEGEIVEDEEVVNYNPLKRPDNYSTLTGDGRFTKEIQESESEGELQTSSSSDSDSDSKVYKSKKPKLKLRPITVQKSKRKKYDIWSNRIQEDVLLETLNSCDVTKKDRSRDVETYDYTLSYSYNEGRTNNKRSRNDRDNKNIRPIKRKGEKEKKGKSRCILDLTLTADSTNEEVATEISNKLCEEKVDLIYTIVAVLGKNKAVKLYEKVKEIELDGGMLIMNQTRRRTPGGIYLFLVKHDNELTSDQKLEIFGDEKEKYRMDQKMKKKEKRQRMKAKIAMEQKKVKILPELLTQAEQCMQELVSNENNRTRAESDDELVVNPPPTPETDGQETSGDSTDNPNMSPSENQRKLQNYSEDYLDINVDNDMDLF